MDEQIVKALLKKAIGYTYDEVQEEYTITETGDSILTKKKVVKKYCPPDSAALKTYLELSPEKSYADMSDEELEAEKTRLLEQLASKSEQAKNKNNKKQNKSKDGDDPKNSDDCRLSL